MSSVDHRTDQFATLLEVGWGKIESAAFTRSSAFAIIDSTPDRVRHAQVRSDRDCALGAQAQAAFQRAIDIWSSLLITTVPIEIEASFTTFEEEYTLGATRPSFWRCVASLNICLPLAGADDGQLIAARRLRSTKSGAFPLLAHTVQRHPVPSISD